ncbi:uncharacterized protein A4U43_C05F18410 [Asparagus officinalis]|uniref:Uncharacterized protein n=1 Tax=Asparagus officinalis TaxID=4686 RepID=A0A5P1ESS8_ASPOF|nr:uncharacterized protein A4U43_C05F18410 [Asparagus officinalis]
MTFDPRQVVAAFLTLSMFAMLGNMIKQDHFDSYKVRLPTHVVHLDAIDNIAHGNNVVPEGNQGPWMEKSPELKPCLEEGEQSKGFVSFSLTTGPEYHLSQLIILCVLVVWLYLN